MSNKQKILIGTAILTATGIASRFIGFFFRMFLSHSFGEEQVGLYQLIFPIYALCFSLTCAGIETAISRCTARKISLGKREEAIQLLYTGLSLSFILSLIVLFGLQTYASQISCCILDDTRCEPLLITISYSIPFASIHSCIVGFYIGLKQTKLPAISQLIEQILRVITVYIMYLFIKNTNGTTNISLAVIGIVVGECCATFFCIQYFAHREKCHFTSIFPKFVTLSKELLQLAIPLTASRVLLNLLQSVEAISIPLRLQQYGYSSSEALRNYGVLTGMVLPCILFPSAITNSVSTMLLPTVAEIQANQSYQKLKSLVQQVFFSCTSMGIVCGIILFVFAPRIGTAFFHSLLASDYLKTICWICPFLYLNTTLLSVLNGLGKTTISFCINTLSLSIRVCGILLFIPKIGMNGYLWSLLLSQILTFIICTNYLLKYLKKRV